MKKFIRIKAIVFILVVCVVLQNLTYILRDKNYADRMYPYFSEKENSIDILLCGPSTMDTGISPMSLWDKYGYTAYNIANGGQSLAINYWALKVAFKTQTPKLVVLDLAYLFQRDKLAGQPARMHQFVDNIPFSMDKVRSILDCVEPQDRAEYFWNIILYHSRWEELTETDFSTIQTLTKGAAISFSKGSDELSAPLTVLPEEEKISLEPYGLSLSYIDKIRELCQENNCELLTINLPSYAADRKTLQKMWNAFTDYAEEHQIPYLNMLHHIDEIGIRFTEDYYDWRHTNYFGNQKLTSYLGNYIKENYELTDHRNEEAYADWWKAYEEYDIWAASKLAKMEKE